MGCGGASNVSVDFARTSQKVFPVFCACLRVPGGSKSKAGCKIQCMDKFAVAACMDYIMRDTKYLIGKEYQLGAQSPCDTEFFYFFSVRLSYSYNIL